MYKYQNESDTDLVIVGVGQVKAGQAFSSPKLIENPSIKLISSDDNGVTSTTGQQANAVTEAEKIETKETK